ncbi:copper chaperone PCu(A)C [Nonomuraea sp. NPDC050556]|uniref:copper chaperone PCu(A)C n=1 Tax=Nonomuraea sp. NPDC050556 TaxID=3364369 RepID=UPI00379B0678
MHVRHALIAVAVAASCLTACGSQQPAAVAAAPAAKPARPLTVTDPWVKTAKKGMSAAFGTLVNHTAAPITVVSAATVASPMVELHETVEIDGQMKMRPKEGGFVIPANGSLELKPGGNHIMLMGVAKPVLPGSQLEFTLKFADGATMEFTAVGKDFAGANEKYQPGHG